MTSHIRYATQGTVCLENVTLSIGMYYIVVYVHFTVQQVIDIYLNFTSFHISYRFLLKGDVGDSADICP